MGKGQALALFFVGLGATEVPSVFLNVLMVLTSECFDLIRGPGEILLILSGLFVSMSGH